MQTRKTFAQPQSPAVDLSTPFTTQQLPIAPSPGKGHAKRESVQPLLGPSPSGFFTSTVRRPSYGLDLPLPPVSPASSVKPKRIERLLDFLPDNVAQLVQGNLGFLCVAGSSLCFTTINLVVTVLSTNEDARVPTSQLMVSSLHLERVKC